MSRMDYYCEDCHYAWPKQGTRLKRHHPHEAPYYFIEGVVQPAPTQPAEPGQDREAA